MQVDTYIEVAVPLALHGTYTYGVPGEWADLAAIGKRVLVPFGTRRIVGYILGPAEPSDQFEVKRILDVMDDAPLFPESMVPFFRWIADYYIYPLGQVVQSALPSGLQVGDDIRLTITADGRRALNTAGIPRRQHEVLNALIDGPATLSGVRRKLKKDFPRSLFRRMGEKGYLEMTRILLGKTIGPKTERFLRLHHDHLPEDRFFANRKAILDWVATRGGEPALGDLTTALPQARGYLKYLQEMGCLEVFEKPVYRDPFGDSVLPDTPLQLNDEQQRVVSDVIEKLGKGFAAYLLAGVTGSGKTEVYMQIAAQAIQKSTTVLVLVPEIALISQTGRRFRARFGERIAILHSGLSAGERYDQWQRICGGEAPIVIGARSAIFAPLIRPGLIIVDEEHDSSYKQESGLRYNARDLAVMRAKLDQGIAVLGSATPSVQSVHNVSQNKFIPLHLHHRVQQRPLPEVQVVDLNRQRDERGFERFISPVLHTAMQETLAHGDQVLLFLNRRGFASYPICAACGEPMRCKNCDISLTLHKKSNAYRCHFCGYSRAAVSECSVCGFPGIKPFGLGTEKVEETAAALFPGARVARLDRDTTLRKGAMVRLLKDLKHRKIDIMVGTQMVAKGHDFSHITLVGVICADLSLNFPDFRSGEFTFQLLAQVSGRAGRGDVPGRVILQTFNPDHFSIKAATHQDYNTFYDHEIHFRRALDYPPFSRMILLRLSGKDQARTADIAQKIGEYLHHLNHRSGKRIHILGPIEAPLAKIANSFRWQILLKSRDVNAMRGMISQMMSAPSFGSLQRHVRLSIDVDPVYMM